MVLNDIKPGKYPGFDGIHLEFLPHCGKFKKTWLEQLFSNILHITKITSGTVGLPYEDKLHKASSQPNNLYTGWLYKLLRIVPCLTTVNLFKEMLYNTSKLLKLIMPYPKGQFWSQYSLACTEPICQTEIYKFRLYRRLSPSHTS